MNVVVIMIVLLSQCPVFVEGGILISISACHLQPLAREDVSRTSGSRTDLKSFLASLMLPELDPSMTDPLRRR